MSQNQTELDMAAREARRTFARAVFIVLILGSLLVALLTGSRQVLGGAVILIGVGSFLVTLGKSNEQLKDDWRKPTGRWLGWLNSKAPGISPRAMSFVFDFFITAIGVISLLG
jgi:hypothetical protein